MESRVELIPGPEHPITIEPTGERVVVRVEGRVVADSTDALTLNEAGYRPVHYIPTRDVDETLLRSSSKSTYCPYKGDASYYTVSLPDRDIHDVIWTYKDPFPAVGAIGDHLAFYRDRVEIIVGTG